MREGRSFGLRGVRFDALDHVADPGDVTRTHVFGGGQMLDERGDVAIEQALRQLTDHRVLHLALGHRRAVVVLAGLGGSPPGDDTTALESRQHRGNGGLGEPALGVQGLPDVLDRCLAPVPQDAQDGELQLGELVALRHAPASWLIYRRRFTTVVFTCQGASNSSSPPVPLSAYAERGDYERASISEDPKGEGDGEFAP